MSTHWSVEREGSGLCGVLSVLLPGAVERNIGVIVIDDSNQAHLKISEVLFTADADILEYWSEIEEYLISIAADSGGREMLRLLHDTGSNFLQVNSIFPCGVDDAEATVALMYKQHVILRRQSNSDSTANEVTAHRYSPVDLYDTIDRLPVSSRHSIQAIQTFRRSKDPFPELEKMLNEDPVMAGQIIYLANIGKFFRGGEVRSVKQALQMVGTETALGYVLALALRPLYSSPSLRRIWNDSLRCRATAEMLADRICYRGAIDIPLLALLSNIGKIVLIQLDGFEKQFKELHRHNDAALACERILCGSDHAEIGADLLAKWEFPDDMVSAVRRHHSPWDGDSLEATVLLLAEGVAGLLDGPNVAEEVQTAADQLGLSHTDLGGITTSRSSEWDSLKLAIE